MNNLPKVVTQQRRGRASNPRLLDRKSDALPLSHRATLMQGKAVTRGCRASLMQGKAVTRGCLTSLMQGKAVTRGCRASLMQGKAVTRGCLASLMQGDLSLLLTVKMQVHTYNTH